jgi:lycopene beta-cyclase
MKVVADVIVVGSGPAGLACAAAFAARGPDVALVAPAPDARWPQTYGVWLDELADEELRVAMRATWPRVRVHHTTTAHIDRAYGLVDNALWQAKLYERMPRARVIRAEAHAAEHDRTGTTVHTSAGPIRARLAVDASGTGDLLHRTVGPTLFQLAYGERIAASIGDDMRWMELGDEGSFLYAMPLGDGTCFVEETVLATSARVSHATLRERLYRRLEREGIAHGPALAVEHVRIPMDAPVPPAQRTLGFGAAAGFVHPATGFSIARALRDAPRLAAATAPILAHPEAAAYAGWEAIWPTARRRARAIHLAAARTLAALPPSALPEFFEAFFALPADTRDAWLDDALPATAAARTMTDLFLRLRPRLALRVLAAGPFALSPMEAR